MKKAKISSLADGGDVIKLPWLRHKRHKNTSRKCQWHFTVTVCKQREQIFCRCKKGKICRWNSLKASVQNGDPDLDLDVSHSFCHAVELLFEIVIKPTQHRSLLHTKLHKQKLASTWSAPDSSQLLSSWQQLWQRSQRKMTILLSLTMILLWLCPFPRKVARVARSSYPSYPRHPRPAWAANVFAVISNRNRVVILLRLQSASFSPQTKWFASAHVFDIYIYIFRLACILNACYSKNWSCHGKAL